MRLRGSHRSSGKRALLKQFARELSHARLLYCSLYLLSLDSCPLPENLLH